MICNRYRIAERVVEIRSLYADVHTFCGAYRTEKPADYTVTVTQASIDREREIFALPDETPEESAARLPDPYLEELAVHRMIAEALLNYDTFLFHGSCIAVDGVGYLFTAPSGTGKSTHTRLWRELLGDRAVMVNDDKPMLRVGETVTACGTPWNGKEGLGENLCVPLKAICFLSQAEENRIERISAQEAYVLLMQQVYRSTDPALVRQTLALTDRLLEKVRLYRLGCNMELSAAELSFRVMSGEGQNG